MNHLVKGGLVILNLLLIVLLCFYFEIPTRIVGSFADSESPAPSETAIPRGLEVHDERLYSDKRLSKHLPQPVIDGIKTFVFFLGHARSGHSIVASLMDSHPNMVVSHEANIFCKLCRGQLAPTKSEIYNTIWKNTISSVNHGKRAKTTDGKGYTLTVDGLYQGKYVDHIDVIGDKKASVTTRMLVKRPNGNWTDVLAIFNSLADNLKVIHVIRNPYDNIATSVLYTFNAKDDFGSVKQSNQTYQVDIDTIDQMIERYFALHKAIMDAEKTYNLDIIEIHGRDLISDPRGTLLKLCNDLGVKCSDNYLEICSNKVFKSESRTRSLINWTDDQLKMIRNNIEKYSNLKNYSFDSM